MVGKFLYFFFINIAKITLALLLFASLVFPLIAIVYLKWTAWSLLLYVPVCAALKTLNEFN